MSGLLTTLAAGEPGYVPSNYMPSMKVEIAFNAGYTTPDASRVWTDVSEWVELDRGIGTSFGRQDERSTADANSLTLTLDNSDGRFTAGRSASPYYPNVKIGRPIRLSLMTVAGHTSVRFVGFIDEWPVAWNGTDAYAEASIRASSRLARLGLSTKLRSMLENEILADRPQSYYTLGDPQGATQAVDSSGNSAQPLLPTGDGTLPVVFGNSIGPALDDLTAAEFAGGDYLTTAGSTTRQGFAFECFFRRATAPATTECLLTGVTTERRSVVMNTSGQIEVRVDNVVVSSSASSFADGSIHHVAIRRWGGLFPEGGLYVDGILQASLGGNFGPGRVSVGGGDASVAPFAGVIAHVAFHASSTVEGLVTAARLAEHAEAGLTSFIGQTTDARLAQVLNWAQVQPDEISAEPGDETMTYQKTAGQSVIDVIRDVESTEGGVLFDGRDGRVTFHNRSHRYIAPVAATLDMAQQQVEADYAPRMDRSTLANDVTVDNPTTGDAARAVDTGSVDEYGSATTSAKSVANTYDPLQQKAAWLVASYAEPRSRVPSLSVDVLAQVAGSPSAEDVLQLTVGSRIAVVNQPEQADATAADYFVEGYTESIGPESYRITFNLSPAHPSLSVFVLEDPVRGQLDSTFVLAL